MTRTRNRLYQIAVFAVLAAVFTTLRLSYLTESCLWFDEIFSVHAASQPWSLLLSFVALDLIHPPLFYMLLKLWISIGGDSLWWLRSLPLGFSIAVFVPLSLLLHELKRNFNVIVIIHCLVIVSGIILKYSLEVRMYSLMLFLAVASMWLFVRFLNRGTGFLPLLLINILLIYTHYFGWFVIASEVVAVLILDRKKLLRIATMAGLSAFAFLPWAIAVWNASQLGSGLSQNIGWMSRPGPREIFVLILNLVEPFYFQTGSNQPSSIFLVTIPLILIAAGVSMIGLVNRYQIEKETRKIVALLSIFVLVPLTMAFAVSWLSAYSIWGTRHLIIVFVPFYILASVVFFALPNRGLKISAMVAGCLLFSAAAAMQFGRDVPRYAWCELAPLTAEVFDPAVPLYTVEDLFAYHLWFERRGTTEKPTVMKLNNIDGVREDKAYFLPRGFDEVKRVDLVDLSDEKFWLVHRSNSIKESEPLLRNLSVKGYKITQNKLIDVGGEQIGLYLLER